MFGGKGLHISTIYLYTHSKMGRFLFGFFLFALAANCSAAALIVSVGYGDEGLVVSCWKVARPNYAGRIRTPSPAEKTAVYHR